MSYLFFIGICLFSGASYAWDVTWSSAARIRYESLSDYDFNTNQGDFKSFTGSRFWVLSEVHHEGHKIVFQPQFSRVWGMDEMGKTASGGTADPYLNMHQAYISTPWGKHWSLKLGRQELAYGDELVLGSVAWSNVGRSFDALKLEWQMGHSRLDFFSSKLSDKNSAAPSDGDKDLRGIYFSGRTPTPLLQETDVYFLDINDSTLRPHMDFIAYGARLKGNRGPVDYRAEFTGERISSNTENQIDVEGGLQITSLGRFAINYFLATENYNQLFPTAHKWLGLGDVVSRRNIKGWQIKHNVQWMEKLKTEISYHNFERYKNTEPAYAFSGIALGNSVISDRSVGGEYNFVINYQHSTELGYQVGAAYFVPSDYLEKSGKGDDSSFVYLQVLLKL